MESRILREAINLICLLQKFCTTWEMHRNQRRVQISVSARGEAG